MYKFKKEERLCRKREIEVLFDQGKSFRISKFRVVWHISNDAEQQACKVLLSVSRRNLKRAVDRNRAKRLMREAYRLNKMDLLHYLSSRDISLHLAIIYNGNEVPSRDEAEHKIILILHRLILNNEENAG